LKRKEISGHLFQGRFKSETVENTASFKKVLRYIHQNLLKASFAKDIYDNKWTSIHEYFKPNTFIDTQIPLLLFSQNYNQSITRFKKYIQEYHVDQCLEEQFILRKTDPDVLLLLTHAGIPNTSKLQQLDKQTRNAVLKEIKELEGVSVRQLARVTGISKSVIARI
jgi:putative transposase